MVQWISKEKALMVLWIPKEKAQLRREREKLNN